MNARSAAPEVSRTSGHGNINGGSAQIIPPELLPARILDRLHAEGIFTVADWRRLTRRQKRELWGITRRDVELLDELARGRQ